MAAAEGHSLYIEKLRSLKTLGQLQRGLGRLESQVERCCGDSEVCLVLVGECEGEVKRLGEERTRLLNRIKDIDMDVQRLTELSEALRWDAQVKLAASSVEQYTRTLREVNGVRVTLGLPPLLECKVSVQARERGAGNEKSAPKAEVCSGWCKSRAISQTLSTLLEAGLKKRSGVSTLLKTLQSATETKNEELYKLQF